MKSFIQLSLCAFRQLDIHFHIKHVWLDAKEIQEELNTFEKNVRTQEEKTLNVKMYNQMEEKKYD